MALWVVQKGETPKGAKPLTGLGSGVYELRDDFDTNTYRVVYVVRLTKGVEIDIGNRSPETRQGADRETVESGQAARRGMTTMTIKFTKSSGNVFSDIGFGDVEAEELAAKADLLALITRAIRTRKLSQSRAARLCGVDQPTLSKALSGKLGSITIDRLTRWLVTLGLQVEINVREAPKGRRKGRWGLRVLERASA